ncbi:MAG TPA: sulfotransferase [Caulobacteraceae bacterium]|nr:sulfotransferase [Caulobacteraceae bacterium]
MPRDSQSRSLQLIAIVGCQRSGTTLTGHILGAHPRAALLDEEDGLYDWFRAAAAGDADGGARFERLLALAARKYAEPATRFISMGEHRARLAPGVTRLILKAPNLTYDWTALADRPEPTRIVYPVRDPRAVSASMARLSHIDFIANQLELLDAHPQTASEFSAERACLADASLSPAARRAIIWRLKSGLAHKFEACGLSVFRFRYEDLVAAPDRLARRLAEFAGLTFDPSMLDLAKAYVGMDHGGTDRTRKISPRPAPRPDVRADAEVLAHAGPLASRLGYAEADAAGPVRADA